FPATCVRGGSDIEGGDSYPGRLRPRCGGEEDSCRESVPHGLNVGFGRRLSISDRLSRPIRARNRSPPRTVVVWRNSAGWPLDSPGGGLHSSGTSCESPTDTSESRCC